HPRLGRACVPVFVTGPHLAIVGPTASGKSALALEVARALGDVELVSVDSMQVYRGLDIGTAKPSAAERAAVPHHLIDVADPDAAARIEPGNTRRIARALEVIEITGRPFSSFGTGLQTYGPTVFPVRMAGTWLPREVLNARIALRVDAMRDAGLVDEVRAL